VWGRARLSRLAPRPAPLLGVRSQQEDLTTWQRMGDAKDMKAHEGSYERFIFMMKWGTVLALLTGAMVVLIIAK